MVPGVFGDRSECRLRIAVPTGLSGNRGYAEKYHRRWRNTDDGFGIGNGTNLERRASTVGNAVGRRVELRRVTVVCLAALVSVLGR